MSTEGNVNLMLDFHPDDVAKFAEVGVTKEQLKELGMADPDGYTFLLIFNGLYQEPVITYLRDDGDFSSIAFKVKTYVSSGSKDSIDLSTIGVFLKSKGSNTAAPTDGGFESMVASRRSAGTVSPSL